MINWDINNRRAALYNNNDSIPLWEFPALVNSIAMSRNGNLVAISSPDKIYVLDKITGDVVNEFILNVIPGAISGGPIEMVSDGSFIIATASAGDSDSCWVFGFQSGSTSEIWKHKIYHSAYGMKISGNDSIVIVNSYNQVAVYETFTGIERFSTTINGCQNSMGISGNGDIIATIDLHGWLKVYHWDGSNYTLLWQRMEPPTNYYNWMSAVDVSYDGSLIACGTLNFPTDTTEDGKVLLFKTTSGPTPQWTYTGTGNIVTSVSFSKNGNILSACSWGDKSNLINDLLIFNTESAIPIFSLNSPGSFFSCSTSSNGATVIASGKSVHAGIFGHGGMVYNIAVDTNNINAVNNSIIEDFDSFSCFPNPFVSTTKIKFELKENTNVIIDIYNMNGNKIINLINKEMNAGIHTIEWNAENYNAGIYFCRIITEKGNGILKIIHL
ncbi:MAG: T9SS type A sorting domain-containing protein [Bacteroidales bacterium]|nr:T9SS type A sorting domain-containing protein [Bacteroidales bacterium]